MEAERLNAIANHLTDLQSRAFALDVTLIRALGGGYREALHQNPESNT